MGDGPPGGRRYKVKKSISKNPFCEVMRVTELNSGKDYALKRIKYDPSTYVTALAIVREVTLHRLLGGHDHVIEIVDILVPKTTTDFRDTYVILELMRNDLEKTLRTGMSVSSDRAKYYTFQIISGLQYLHDAGVIHRDIKPSNILVNDNGRLKISDLGLARPTFIPDDKDSAAYFTFWTGYGGRRWYRAPEIQVEDANTEYDTSIDIWAVGCIFGELVLGRPLFPGTSSMDMLERITDFTGTPDDNLQQTIQSNGLRSALERIPKKTRPNMSQLFPSDADPMALQMIEKMLVFDPAQRITAKEAFNNECFRVWRESSGTEKLATKIQPSDFAYEQNPRGKNDEPSESLQNALLREIVHFHPDKRERLLPTSQSMGDGDESEAGPVAFDKANTA